MSNFAQVNQPEGSILFTNGQQPGFQMNMTNGQPNMGMSPQQQMQQTQMMQSSRQQTHSVQGLNTVGNCQEPQFKTQDKINKYKNTTKREFTLNQNNINKLSGNNSFMLNRMTVPSQLKRGGFNGQEDLKQVEGYDAQGHVVSRNNTSANNAGVKNFEPFDNGYNSQFSNNFVVFDNGNQGVSVNKMNDGAQNGTISGQVSPTTYESPYLTGDARPNQQNGNYGQYHGPSAQVHSSQQQSAQQFGGQFTGGQQFSGQQFSGGQQLGGQGVNRSQQYNHRQQPQQHRDSFLPEMRHSHQPQPPMQAHCSRLDNNSRNDQQANMQFSNRQFENQNTYNSQQYVPTYLEYQPRDQQMHQQLQQQRVQRDQKTREYQMKQQTHQHQLSQNSENHHQELSSPQINGLPQRPSPQSNGPPQANGMPQSNGYGGQQQQMAHQQFHQEFQAQVNNRGQDDFVRPPEQQGIYDNGKDNYQRSFDASKSQQKPDFRNPYVVHGNAQLEQMRQFKNSNYIPSAGAPTPMLQPNFGGMGGEAMNNYPDGGGSCLNEAFIAPSTEASFINQFTQGSR